MGCDGVCVVLFKWVYNGQMLYQARLLTHVGNYIPLTLMMIDTGSELLTELDNYRVIKWYNGGGMEWKDLSDPNWVSIEPLMISKMDMIVRPVPFGLNAPLPLRMW